MSRPVIPQVVADLPRIGYRIVQTRVEYNSDRASGASIENPYVVLRLEYASKDAMEGVQWTEQNCWTGNVNSCVQGDFASVPFAVLCELLGSIKLGRHPSVRERINQQAKEESDG